MVYRNKLVGQSYPGPPAPRGKAGGLIPTESYFMANYQSSSRSKYMQPKPAYKKWNKKFPRRNEAAWNQGMSSIPNGVYEPPRLNELWQQNRLKTRRFFPKKRAPKAPRNTTSFIMRAKKSGGLASLVSPVTPAILPTPFLSPAPRYREGLVDEVKKEWGVDGYGSMNGLIRLRSMEGNEQDGFGSWSESEGEQETHAQSVQQLEQRIDHDLSRFEIVYPSPCAPAPTSRPLEVRVEELESQIAHLEDENLSLKENLYLMRQELIESRRHQHLREGEDHVSDDDAEVCSGRSAGDMSCAQS